VVIVLLIAWLPIDAMSSPIVPASVAAASDSVSFSIRNPFLASSELFAVVLDEHSTVRDLKAHLATAYPSRPNEASQRLIFDGRLLANDEVLSAVLESVPTERRIIHLAVRGASAATPTSVKKREGEEEEDVPASAAVAPATTAPAAVKSESVPPVPILPALESISPPTTSAPRTQQPAPSLPMQMQTIPPYVGNAAAPYAAYQSYYYP
jgi:hypothetical protein